MPPLVGSPGAQDVHIGIFDLSMAIQAAATVDECLRLNKIAQTLSLEVQECAELALARAAQLNGVVQHADGYR